MRDPDEFTGLVGSVGELCKFRCRCGKVFSWPLNPRMQWIRCPWCWERRVIEDVKSELV